MIRSRHVRGHEIKPPVIVHVALVDPHREPGKMRQNLLSDFLESPPLFVAVKTVGAIKIIGNVKVRPTIPVIIKPNGGQPFVRPRDAKFTSDFPKLVSVIAV